MAASEQRELVAHLGTEELEAGLPEIRLSPADEGTVELIVRRPVVDERELLEEAELDLERGLVGDDWYTRGSKSTERRLVEPPRAADARERAGRRPRRRGRP